MFHRFRQAKFANGGSILSSSQFLATVPAASRNEAYFKSSQSQLIVIISLTKIFIFLADFAVVVNANSVNVVVVASVINAVVVVNVVVAFYLFLFFMLLMVIVDVKKAISLTYFVAWFLSL